MHQQILELMLPDSDASYVGDATLFQNLQNAINSAISCCQNVMSSPSPLSTSNVFRVLSEVTVLSSGGVSYKSPADVTVALLHSALLTLGFRCVGLGEDNSIAAAALINVCVDMAGDQMIEGGSAQKLPDSWNVSNDVYAFRYRHTQSSFTFLVKTMKIASKLIITAMSIEEGKVHQLEITLSDFVDPNNFPTNAVDTTTIESLFSSDALTRELLYLFKVNIVQKLIPGLHKPGYEESTSISSTSSHQTQPQRYSPYRDPLRDYSRPNREPLPHPEFGSPYGNPYSIGDADLDPFAAAPGLPGRFPLMGGGGMFVGPNHPMFGGVGRPFGPGLPGPNHPFGARYDPIGPLGGYEGPRPGWRPSRGPGGMGGQGDFFRYV
ncbi:hypothetical protein HK096_004086 [Nowakowskiella sp. JEL0078]|nr:hypothetical protein HK096_004086 [Nowakowskiella sp. JEL0078]